MSEKVGSIHYDVGLNTKEFDSKSKHIIDSMQKTAKRMAFIGAGMAAAFAVLGVKTAAQLETARQGFVTLLGSAEEADKTIARIKKEALRTPFEVPGLTQGAQMLTAVTKDGDKAVDMLLDVGEALAAVGRGQPEMNRIMVNLQQVGSLGRAQMIDIKQFAYAGIPIYEMLADVTGKAGEELGQLIQDGGVTFELLTDMFKDATEEGGRFAGAYENVAGTFNQSLSNMKDTIQIVAADIITNTGIFDGLKDAMLGITNWIFDNRESIMSFFSNLGRVFAEWWEQIQKVAIEVGNYLLPKLENLWDKIQNKVIPALSDFWKNYIEPLIPVIGTVIVVALGLFIDALALLADKIDILIPVLVAWGAVMLGAQVAGAISSITALVGIGAHMGLRGALTAMTAQIGASAMTAGWVLWAAAIMYILKEVYDAANETKDALDDMAGISNDAVEDLEQAKKDLDDGKITIEEYKTKANEAASKANYVSTQVKAANDDMNNSFVGKLSRGISSAFRTMTGQAMGGPVTGNRPYMVGERGPELFMPKASGHIIPNDQLNNSTSIYGDVNIGSQGDADYFFGKLNRNNELLSKGLAGQAGTV